MLHFEKAYTRLSRLAQDQSGDVATQVEESALGVRVIKSFGRSDHVYDRFDEQLTKLYDTQVGRVSVSAKFWTFLEVIPNLTPDRGAGFGAVAAGHGCVTLGTLVAFITLMLSLVWPVASLGFLLSMAQESMTAADRIAEIFDAPREHHRRHRRADRRRAAGGSSSSTSASASPTADAWCVARCQPDRRPGETLALVGATGSGKSMLTALVSRLYDVTGGGSRIDGVDVRDLSLAALRQAGGDRVRGPDAVLDVGARRTSRSAGLDDQRPTTVAQAIEIAAGAVRLRPAVRAWTPASASRA